MYSRNYNTLTSALRNYALSYKYSCNALKGLLKKEQSLSKRESEYSQKKLWEMRCCDSCVKRMNLFNSDTILSLRSYKTRKRDTTELLTNY
jgi:hypothetical protein